jgi:hypothetical protein
MRQKWDDKFKIDLNVSAVQSQETEVDGLDFYIYVLITSLGNP